MITTSLLSIVCFLCALVLFQSRVTLCESETCKRQCRAGGVTCAILGTAVTATLLYALTDSVKNLLQESPAM